MLSHLTRRIIINPKISNIMRCAVPLGNKPFHLQNLKRFSSNNKDQGAATTIDIESETPNKQNSEINEEMISGNSVNLDDVNLYEKFKEYNEIGNEWDDKDNALKELSLKLLNATDPVQVLGIFEIEYLHNVSGRSFFGEELAILLKFLHQLIKENLSIPQAIEFLQTDQRIGIIIDWLVPRFSALDIEYKLSTISTLGIFMSQFQYRLESDSDYETLLNGIDISQIQGEHVKNLPTMIFILPFFNIETNLPQVQQVVGNLTSLYYSEHQDSMDIMAMAALAQGWANIGLSDNDLFLALTTRLIKEHAKGVYFESEGMESFASIILSALSNLGFNDPKVNEVLFEILVGAEYIQNSTVSGQYDFYTIYDIIQSFARLEPQNTKYYSAFAPILADNLNAVNQMKEDDFRQNPVLLMTMVPDLDVYVNLWLSLATFAAKQQTSGTANFTPVTDELVFLLNNNFRWNATNLNLKDTVNISLAIAILKLDNESFISDIGNLIRAHLDEVDQLDLVNLAKSTRYMRKTPKAEDLYDKVHESASMLKISGDMSENVEAALKKIYKDHGIFENSIFY